MNGEQKGEREEARSRGEGGEKSKERREGREEKNQKEKTKVKKGMQFSLRVYKGHINVFVSTHLLSLLIKRVGGCWLFRYTQDDVGVIGVKQSDRGFGDVRDSLTVPDNIVLPPLVDQIVVLNGKHGVGKATCTPSPLQRDGASARLAQLSSQETGVCVSGSSPHTTYIGSQ